MRVGANRRRNRIKFTKLVTLRSNTLRQRYCSVSEIIGRVCFFSHLPVRCSLTAYRRSSPWSSPWRWRRLSWATPSTSCRYLTSRATHRCCSTAPPIPLRRSFPLFLISCPSLFCIRVHFHPPFIFSPDTFSIPSLWRRVFCALPSIIFGFSSFIHLHCYSCASDDGGLESQRVPIITESLRPDLNTQCVWWMEATSPH